MAPISCKIMFRHHGSLIEVGFLTQNSPPGCVLCFDTQDSSISVALHAVGSWILPLLMQTVSPFHSGQIQLSWPVLSACTRRRRCFLLRWLGWLPEEMLLLLHWNTQLAPGPQLLFQTWCYSCSRWFGKGHGKIRGDFMRYCYWIYWEESVFAFGFFVRKLYLFCVQETLATESHNISLQSKWEFSLVS